MEGSCSTGQSPQQDVVPVEEEEEEEEEDDDDSVPLTDVIKHIFLCVLFNFVHVRFTRDCLERKFNYIYLF
jgi:hypothetical protein